MYILDGLEQCWWRLWGSRQKSKICGSLEVFEELVFLELFVLHTLVRVSGEVVRVPFASDARVDGGMQLALMEGLPVDSREPRVVHDLLSSSSACTAQTLGNIHHKELLYEVLCFRLKIVREFYLG